MGGVGFKYFYNGNFCHRWLSSRKNRSYMNSWKIVAYFAKGKHGHFRQMGPKHGSSVWAWGNHVSLRKLGPSSLRKQPEFLEKTCLPQANELKTWFFKATQVPQGNMVSPSYINLVEEIVWRNLVKIHPSPQWSSKSPFFGELGWRNYSIFFDEVRFSLRKSQVPFFLKKLGWRNCQRITCLLVEKKWKVEA